VSRSPSPDPYRVLGLSRQASSAEIKAAYRALVKQHHPDAGGDAHTIVELNAAWAVLGDRARRRRHDQASASVASNPTASSPGTSSGPGKVPRPDAAVRSDGELRLWLQKVYGPIDRLLGQVINPLAGELRALSADPYDDELMGAFCGFLEKSRARLDKVESLYRSLPCPAAARGFGLSLYHCLSQVQDGVAELERYTMGYVDSYLHDGREMLREAMGRRSRLQQERRRLEI
jgi:molecular chaperone DnaJ